MACAGLPIYSTFGWVKGAILVLVPWAALVALWYAIHYSGIVNPVLVPTPHAVAERFWELAGSRLPRDVWMSTQRVFLGVVLGILLAVPVGFVLGWYRGARRFIDPLINFFRALPPIALIPLVIVYFGIEETAKVVILFYASFFAGVIVMYEGIAQISPIYVRVARTLGARDLEIFLKVIVPLTVPHMLTALRVALGVAWATLVASELIEAIVRSGTCSTVTSNRGVTSVRIAYSFQDARSHGANEHRHRRAPVTAGRGPMGPPPPGLCEVSASAGR